MRKFISLKFEASLKAQLSYDDLNLYSKYVHNNIDYDIKTGNWIVIVEI